MFKFISTIVFFTSLISASSSFAEVSFDFEGLFPNQTMKNLLDSANGSYENKNIEFKFDTQDFIPGLEVESFLFDYNLNLELALGEDGSLGGFFSLPDAQLKVNKVDLTYSTESDVGGALINIKTKLQCDEAYLNIKKLNGFVKGQLAIEEGRFLFDKERAAMQLGDLTDAFSIDLEGCTGAKGLEPVIKEELINWIVSEAGKAELLNIVIDSIIDFINLKMEEFQNIGYVVPFMNKKVRVKLNSGYFLREGFSFKGEASFDHNEELSFEIESSIDLANKNAVFRLPASFASKILPMFVKSSDNAKLSFDRKAIPGADTLFNNRFVQFFVWSDLMNFKKNTDFALDVNLSVKQSILQDVSSNSLKFHVYSEHSTDFDLKDSKGKIYPYMNFDGRLSSSLFVNFDKEGFDLSLSNFGIESDSGFDTKMKTWRRKTPGGKPWMSMILKQARAALNQTSFSWKWSELGLGALNLKSVKIKSDKKNFDIVFDL